MRALASFSEHYGPPNLAMSWWLFLILLHQVTGIEARALLRSIDGPAVALNRLSEQGQFHFEFIRDQVKELA